MQQIRAVSLERPVVNLKARRYKDELYLCVNLIKIMAGLLVTLFVLCIGMAIQIGHYKINNNKLTKQFEEINDELLEAKTSLACADTYISEMESSLGILREDTKGFQSVIDELDEQNAGLLKENKKLAKELDSYKEREELYDKYEYALYDTAGNRTDLTYDQIKTGEELMVAKGMDPDLLFGILMTESGGKENASNPTSTARGYGQLLKGTGQFVYENLQGNAKGSYSHQYAYNGDMNIAMTVDLLNYFKNDRGLSLHKAIQSYRGLSNVSGYEAKINSYISKSGDSLSAIAAKW